MKPLNTAEDAAQLLVQVGERLGEHLRVVAIGPNRWCALFKHGGACELEWSEDWGWLVLTAELGHPSLEGERAALNLALSYNALWRQLGSLRMARNGTGGELLLIGELGAEDSEPEDFCAALLHFEGLRRWWGDALARVGDAIPGPPSTPIAGLQRI